jgi:hypothetical protein
MQTEKFWKFILRQVKQLESQSILFPAVREREREREMERERKRFLCVCEREKGEGKERCIMSRTHLFPRA